MFMQNLSNILRNLLSEQTEMYNMTESDLKVMLMYHMERDSNLLGDKIKGDQKLVASAKRLDSLGLADYDGESLKIDLQYRKYLLRNNMIDDSGEITDKGKEVLRT